MPDDGKSVNRPWQEIAAEMTQEQDNERLLQLAKELNQTMQQEERKRSASG
jgi:hypothetical protein